MKGVSLTVYLMLKQLKLFSMKPLLKTIVAFCVLFISITLLSSCSKGEGGDDSDILGRWEKKTQITYYPGGWQSGSSPQTGYVVQYYEFYSGGKGVEGQSSPSPSYSTYQHTCTWTRNGNNITVGGTSGTLSGSSLTIGGNTYRHTSWWWIDYLKTDCQSGQPIQQSVCFLY